MPISIRTNLSSINAQKNLSQTQEALKASFSKLSSGQRITTAADDAAGMGIATNLNAQIRSYAQASRNALDGISVVQVAEGALNEIAGILTRMRELAIQAASDGVGTTQRAYIETERQQLEEEIDRIANATEYNGNKLLDGVSTTSLTFHVGIRDDDTNDRITINMVDATAATLGVDTLNFADAADAVDALATIDAALNTISNQRANLGAAGNRLNVVVSQIQTARENLSAGYSRIMDVDVAEETSTLTRNQVLMQAGVAVLSQANQAPQAALPLLQ